MIHLMTARARGGEIAWRLFPPRRPFRCPAVPISIFQAMRCGSRICKAASDAGLEIRRHATTRVDTTGAGAAAGGVPRFLLRHGLVAAGRRLPEARRDAALRRAVPARR